VGAVSDRLPRHGAHLAFVERVIDGRPVDEARLRLHDPVVPPLPAAHEVAERAVAIRVEMSLPDIVVPGGEIEVVREGVVIPVVAPAEAAEVAGDELPRG